MEELVNQIGGLAGIASFIGFIAFYFLNRQKLKADIRVSNADADVKSLEFLTGITNELRRENDELRQRIKDVEFEIHQIKSKNGFLDRQVQCFKEAIKCRLICKEKDCPIEAKFKELGGNYDTVG